MTCEPVTNHCCLLGEGPVWDSVREQLLWVDIEAGQIHSYSPATGKHQVVEVGLKVGAVALRESGGVIAALQNGLAFVNLETGEQQWIASVEADQPETRLNDGKCDPGGRFWVGTMGTAQVTGNLYMLDTELSLTVKVEGVQTSNGLAWSLDQKTLYFIDTPTLQVVAFDFDLKTGGIGQKRKAIAIPPEMGRPDGMTIDSEGMLWIALWEGWGVGRWNPKTGELLQKVEVPVARVTSCTFGGPALSDLYITTAKMWASEHELLEQPLAGALFVVKNCGFTGIPAVSFKG